MGLFPTSKTQSAASSNVDTVIGAEAVFEGVLITENSVCVEGTFRGRLESKGRVILNGSAKVEADIVAEYVAVNGSVSGNVKALQQLDVGVTGVIRGDVTAGSVTVAKGGILEGTCHMASDTSECSSQAKVQNLREPAALLKEKRREGEPHPLGEGNGAGSQPEERTASAEA